MTSVTARATRAAMRRLPVLMAAAMALPAPAAMAQVATQKAAIAKLLDARYPHLDALYKDIHAHPELGFAETRTAARLAKEMRALGFDVTEGIGGTGIVAIYRNGPGPVVMVRTELDALPMKELTGLDYASRVRTIWNGQPTDVMHGCGHDVHMASWVGTAAALVAMKSAWKGTLMFVGQPSEEMISGAAAMLKNGLFTRFPKPDFALALHNAAYAHGTVHYRPGVLSSNSDDIAITFKGRGGHGADPSKTIDPVLIAARFVVDVQAVVSREKTPQRPGVVTIGAINGGSAGNIIPDQVTVRGTIRNYDAEVRARLKEGVARVARAEAVMAGAPEPDIAIGEQHADAVVNDPALTAQAAAVFHEAFGDNAILDADPITASEDYSLFVNAGVPRSLFFLIGVHDPAAVAAARNGGPPLAFNHSPHFAPVPEPTIRTGVEAMTLAVLRILAPN
jgi:hippurate hydrolase